LAHATLQTELLAALVFDLSADVEPIAICKKVSDALISVALGLFELISAKRLAT
jgi:hypothetical protein